MYEHRLSSSNSNEGAPLTPLKKTTLPNEKQTKKSVLSLSVVDSFQSARKATPQSHATAVESTKKGIPVVTTALIALTSLGVGVGAVLTARHLNWFELGQKTKTTVTEKIPEAVATALKVGKEATQEQITKKIEGLQSQIANLEEQIAKAPDSATLQADLSTAKTALATATQNLTNETQAHGATAQQVVEKDVTITDLQGQIQAKQREILIVQEELTHAKNELTQKDQDFQASRTAYQERENQILDLQTQLSTAQQTLTAERNKLTEEFEKKNQELTCLQTVPSTSNWNHKEIELGKEVAALKKQIEQKDKRHQEQITQLEIKITQLETLGKLKYFYALTPDVFCFC